MSPKLKRSVRLLSIAEQDLQELLLYVAAENSTAALVLADKIEAELAKLGTYPYLGKIPQDTHLAQLEYRVLVVGDYLLFYKIKGRTILIYRILHGARDVPRLLEDA
ncbi:MAG: type II toxin-antitoxin system RelE/ParE family toxin [Nitrospirota bacterium]|nr:type II toxin-antitoxin system RelE/ParE family toxin [Nitrospirota bacterium]